MNRKLVFGIIVFIAILVVGWIVIGKSDDTTPNQEVVSSNSTSNKTERNAKDKLIIGEADAPVTIVEVADYKCPTCNTFFREIEPNIRRDYIDKGIAKFEIVMFPHIGTDAKPAAVGAYCALEQKKFASYHDGAMNFINDQLFSKGQSYSDEIFTNDNLSTIANNAGLNQTKFDECVKNETTLKLVERDLNFTEQQEITGTPTFIIGDQRVVGAQPYEIFRALIEQELN